MLPQNVESTRIQNHTRFVSPQCWQQQGSCGAGLQRMVEPFLQGSQVQELTGNSGQLHKSPTLPRPSCYVTIQSRTSPLYGSLFRQQAASPLAASQRLPRYAIRCQGYSSQHITVKLRRCAALHLSNCGGPPFAPSGPNKARHEPPHSFRSFWTLCRASTEMLLRMEAPDASPLCHFRGFRSTGGSVEKQTVTTVMLSAGSRRRLPPPGPAVHQKSRNGKQSLQGPREREKVHPLLHAMSHGPPANTRRHEPCFRIHFIS